MNGLSSRKNNCLSVILFISLSLGLNAQLDEKDPFRDNYILGNSAEIFLIRAAHDTMEFRILDAGENMSTDGIMIMDTKFELVKEWCVLDFRSPVAIISGNFNDDKFTDVVAAWQTPDSSVSLFHPVIDPQTLKITDNSKVHLLDSGLPKMYNGSTSMPRLIALDKGQFDSDRQKEIVLAYMADHGHPDGGQIFISIFDINQSTGEPELKDTISAVQHIQDVYNVIKGLNRGSLFDIATGDFNRDGIDEVVLTTVLPVEHGDDLGWRLDAFMYQIRNGHLVKTAQTIEPIYEEGARSSDYLQRLGIATGYFDDDYKDDIAITYQNVESGNGDSDIYLRALSASVDSFYNYGSEKRIDGSNGNNGWPMSIKSGDFNQDGRDEIHLATRYNLRSYGVNDDMSISTSGHFGVGISTDQSDIFSETFVITDMDIENSDTLKQEIVIFDQDGLQVYQKNSQGFIVSGEPVAELELYANAIIEGDFNGDALRLGPPKRQTRSDVVQPIMILSSPPIHIDVFDGEVFDLQDCYPLSEVTNISRCYSSHVSFTSIEGSTIESSTEVRSSWNTSKSISASVGGKKGFFSAKVSGSLEQRYGEGFKNINGSSRAYELSAKSESREDDLIYCLVSNYELLEYPVYAEDTLLGQVLAVIPGETNEAWFPGRSSIANAFHSNHEVGNILSYPKSTDLPPGARPFGVGGYQGGSDTWTVSPSTVQNWNLKFGSETITERESYNSTSLTRKLSAEIGLNFKFVNASVKGAYQDKQFDKTINTHKTTIKESSEIEISMGLINSSFVGSKTYDVTPFMYWDASGVLILDYAVSPDFSGGVPSWWEEKYGSKPDLTFILPWRHQESKGLGGKNDDLQSQQTRDIIVSPLDPQQGDTATIFARIQNYSNVDQFGTSVKFYLGDPDEGGQLIVNKDGLSEVQINQINAREPVVASLENWVVPPSIENETMIFAVIDPDNLVDEVHENNNKAWNLINLGFANTVTGIEDMIYEDISFSADNRVEVYPNPVQHKATFRFAIEKPVDVRLSIYDMQGRLIEHISPGNISAGIHHEEYLINDLDSGMYLFVFRAGDYTEAGKMIIK